MHQNTIVKTSLSGLLIWVLLINSISPVFATAAALPPAQQTIILPSHVEQTLQPGDSATFTITVQTGSAPIPKVDVLFLFDVTGSMGDEINQAKARSTYIMNQLKTRIPDSAFGLASFADYPGSYSSPGYRATYGAAGDYPWRLDQPITTDVATVQNAIDGLSLKNGEDGPESYLRALWEAANIDWRPGAKHIIVLFGDAPAHDPDFYTSVGGGNFGLDPGPDGVVNTPDDLRMTSVIDMVRSRGITIIAVNSADPKSNGMVQAGFEYMARQTEGKVYPLPEADKLADVVASGLETATSRIAQLLLTPPPEYAAWIQTNPASHSDVKGGESRAFQVTLTVPPGTAANTYTFPLTAMGDNVALANATITVYVGAASSLDVAEILNKKRELINRLSRLQHDTQFLSIPLRLTALKSYDAEEAQVKAWLDSLPPGGGLSPAQAEALLRISEQEEGLENLWVVSTDSASIGNNQVAHIIGVVISMISMQKFLKALEGKKFVGRLITKLNNQIRSKLLGLTLEVMEWGLSGLPDERAKGGLLSALAVIGEGFDAHLSNALKTTNYAKDFTQDIFVGLIADLLVLPLDEVTSNIYVEKTRPEVAKGLNLAQNAAARSIAMDEVERIAPQITANVDNVVQPMKARADSLESLYDDFSKAQDVLDAGASIAEVVTLVAAPSSATGVGAIITAVSKGVAIALRLVDIAMSGYLAIDAYMTWGDFDQASALTTTAFGPPIALSYTRERPLLSQKDLPSKVYFTPRDRNLPASVRALETHTQEQVDTYDKILVELAAAIKRKDMAATERLIDQLLMADENVTLAFDGSRRLIIMEAPDFFQGNNEDFKSAYSRVSINSAHFAGEGAILYLYLSGFLVEPASEAMQQGSLNQIQVVRRTSKDYNQSLKSTLPLLRNAGRQSIVVLGAPTINTQSPISGSPIEVATSVENLSTVDADGVQVVLYPSENVELVGDKAISVGMLPAGESHPIRFQATLTGESGMVRMVAETSNGVGSERLVYLDASDASSYLVETPGSGRGGGGLLALFLGVMVLVGVVTVVYAKRKRRAGPTAAHAVLVDSQGRRLAIKDGFVIGRSAASDLRLNDPYVSRQHAQLRYYQGSWFIQDMNSSSGTFVNGVRIQATRLQNGDQIQIGGSIFTFLEQ